MFRPLIGPSSGPPEYNPRNYRCFTCSMGSHMLTGLDIKLWVSWICLCTPPLLLPPPTTTTAAITTTTAAAASTTNITTSGEY